MRLGQFALISSIVLSLTIPAAAATHTRHSISGKSFARHAAKPKLTKVTRTIGQRTIEDDRATQIQAALIKAGYLSGTPTGHWDTQSEAAMGKLQADNGWQTKLVPDSRALIKLGLGPASSPGADPLRTSEDKSIASSDGGSLSPEAR
jgi:peptidoglycan hydrolase-like protein with peptidoglycan-binding domain